MGTGIMRGLDVDRAGLPGVGAETEIVHRHDVGVVEAETRRLRHIDDAAHPVGGNVGRSLLGSAVDIGRNELAVPVQLLRRIGVVVDIYNDTLAFHQTHHRSGKLTIVECRRHNVLRRQFDQSGRDAQRIVGLFGTCRRRGTCWLIWTCRVVGSLCEVRRERHERKRGGPLEQRTTINRHDHSTIRSITKSARRLYCAHAWDTKFGPKMARLQ